MSVTHKGYFTGLLGYSVKRDYLGEFTFRNTETYNYEIIVTDTENVQNASTFINGQLQALFATQSGDINIKTVRIPHSINLGEDQTRTAKYQSTVEVRSAFDFNTCYSEFGTARYSGVSSFLASSYQNLENFNESFSFENRDNGEKTSTHQVSFSLRTGTKSQAQNYASGLLTDDYKIPFGISCFPNALADYGQDASSYNIYSETYDMARNSFSFEKRKNILPTTGSLYTYELKHTISLGEDGFTTVSEDLNIKGKKSFENALNGLSTLSDSYTRCSSALSQYSGWVGTGTLNNIAQTNRLVYNRPSLSISCNTEYSANPTFKNGYYEDISISIAQEENNIINVNEKHSINTVGKMFSVGEGQVTGIFKNLESASLGYSQSYYNQVPASIRQGRTLTLLNSSFSSEIRNRRHSAEFKYSNNPIYVTSLYNSSLGQNVTNFKSVEVSVNDKLPEDEYNEYIIINRPSKTSAVTYSYQSVPGSRSANVRAIISRPSGNMLVTPYLPANEVSALYELARKKILERFINSDTTYYNYYLDNLGYSFASNNEINLDASIVYTFKKRTII